MDFVLPLCFIWLSDLDPQFDSSDRGTFPTSLCFVHRISPCLACDWFLAIANCFLLLHACAFLELSHSYRTLSMRLLCHVVLFVLVG